MGTRTVTYVATHGSHLRNEAPSKTPLVDTRGSILSRLVTESEYCRGLLELHRSVSPGALVEQTLSLLVSRTSARLGYIEVEDEPLDGVERRVWSAHGCSDHHITTIRAHISRALHRTAKLRTTSRRAESAAAAPDIELRRDESRELGASLCVPFGRRLAGAVYVECSQLDAPSGDAVEAVERAASQLSLLFEPVRFYVGPKPSAREAANAELREQIASAITLHGRNLSALEAETQISRKQLRKLLRYTRSPSGH